MGDLANKKVLITGGSRGIGKSIALKFAQEGADIVINFNSNESAAKETVKQLTKIGSHAKSIQANIVNANERAGLLKDCLEFLGKIDILVNNAGVLTRNSFMQITEEEYDKVLDLNLKAHFFMTQTVCSQMIKQGQGGSVINISSISDQTVSKNLAHYECSKAGLTMFSKSVALELAQYNIRVNSIALGPIATDLNREQWQDNPSIWEKRILNIPMGRSGTTEDVVGVAVLLASDRSQWITGSRYAIDGGLGIFNCNRDLQPIS